MDTFIDDVESKTLVEDRLETIERLCANSVAKCGGVLYPIQHGIANPRCGQVEHRPKHAQIQFGGVPSLLTDTVEPKSKYL